MDQDKYNSNGIAQPQNLGSASPASNPGVVYQPANQPTNPGALKSAEQASGTFTVVAINGNRIRTTANTGVSPFQEIGTIAVLNRDNLIVAQLGSDSTSGAPGSEVTAYRSAGNNSNVPLLIVQSDSTHVGAIPVEILTKEVISTHFAPMMQFFKNSGGTTTINFFVSDGTTPNGNLSDVQGSICYNGPGGQPFWCGGGTTWTAF